MSPLINAVFVIDTSTNAVVNTIPLSYSPIFPALTSDGTRLYTVNVENTVSVIDTATKTVTATIPDFACPLRIAITPAPKSKDDCKNGGYRKFGALTFDNQGQCVKYVNRHAN
jgi:YVTN family beta-propeller protein